MNPPGGSDAGFEELFEQAPCGYVVLDPDGRLTHANAEFRRLVGRELAELLSGITLASLLPPGGQVYAQTHLMPMLVHDRVLREVALDLTRPDGTRVPVLLNARTAPDDTVRVVVVEATERHQYERDLLLSTKAAEEARSEATALATTLQQTLIPPAPPRVPGLDLAAAYRPAGDGSIVGGDFYDVFQVDPESWFVVLGDVSGKGISAATVTSFVRYTVRALAFDHPDPSDLLRHLDQAMHIHGTRHYCTLVVVRLQQAPGGWMADLALAGHPPALLRGRGGDVRELGVPGNPVGLIAGATFTTVRHLLTDETLTVYTDGITEARHGDEIYGERRLHGLLAGMPHDVHEITEQVTQAALAFQDGVASDDIAVITFAGRAGSPAPENA